MDIGISMGEGISLISIIIILIFNIINQKRISEQIQQKFFSIYTNRYQNLILKLPYKVHTKNFSLLEIDEKEKYRILKYFMAYIDLCFEEYNLYRQGKLNKNTWKDWREGIKFEFTNKSFIEAWEEINQEGAYNHEFIDFIDEIINEGDIQRKIENTNDQKTEILNE